MTAAPTWDWRGPCNGPRDCVGTERGCAVCDPRIGKGWVRNHPPKKAIARVHRPDCYTIRHAKHVVPWNWADEYLTAHALHFALMQNGSIAWNRLCDICCLREGGA